MSTLMTITLDEYNRLRLCELDNRKYDALVSKLGVRAGGVGYDRAEKVVSRHLTMTLHEFDMQNNFMSVLEVFRLV